MAFAVPGSTTDSLYQGCFRTKEAFLVCIQDRYQCDFRNIQSLSQKVNSNQHIKYIQSHITYNLCTLQSVNI